MPLRGSRTSILPRETRRKHPDSASIPRQRLFPGLFQLRAGGIDDVISGRSAEANAAVVGHTVVTPTGCAGLHERLRARGFATGEVPLGEFIKAGGAAKCLTLRLNGEEAAVPFTKTLPPEALQKTRRT